MPPEPPSPPFSPLSPVTPISPWPPQPLSPRTEPLPSPKEVYGFIAVLLTYLAFGIYLAWAFFPPAWLDAVGWTWYPSREWAVIVPCWMMMMVLLAYWSYAGLSIVQTPPWSSNTLMTLHLSEPMEYYWKFTRPDSIPEAIDLPIDLVNRTLYPPRRRKARDT